MSFSSEVKEELMGIMPNARHCRIAELAALVMMSGSMLQDGGLRIRSESSQVISRCAQLLHKLMDPEPVGQQSLEKAAAKQYHVLEFDSAGCSQICTMLKADAGLVISPIVYQLSCCKRAFLRGVFLSAGSISDPAKDYHLEFVADDDLRAGIITDIISAFDIEAKTVHRKRYTVVYLKDGERIVDVLNIMEAHVRLMELENVRILKEMRNTVNRRVNCEAANIDKTIKAAGRQIEDITYLRDTVGLDSLSEELRTTAQLRLDNPECSLTELGRLHERPVGRSGVNHRLSRLSEMADRLRSGKALS